MNEFNELLILLTQNREQISQELWQQINDLCRKLNQERTIKEHGNCYSCGSQDIYQSGVEVICRDCGYTSEDWSSDS